MTSVIPPPPNHMQRQTKSCLTTLYNIIYIAPSIIPCHNKKPSEPRTLSGGFSLSSVCGVEIDRLSFFRLAVRDGGAAIRVMSCDFGIGMSSCVVWRFLEPTIRARQKRRVVRGRFEVVLVYRWGLWMVVRYCTVLVV